jgi:hypothetical protein
VRLDTLDAQPLATCPKALVTASARTVVLPENPEANAKPGRHLAVCLPQAAADPDGFATDLVTTAMGIIAADELANSKDATPSNDTEIVDSVANSATIKTIRVESLGLGVRRPVVNWEPGIHQSCGRIAMSLG